MVDRKVIPLKCTVLVSRITQQRRDGDCECHVYIELVLQNWKTISLEIPNL